MRAYITPREYTLDTREVLLSIPESTEFIAILRGAILTLTKPENWEQLEGLTITPEEAVVMAELLLQEFEAAL